MMDDRYLDPLAYDFLPEDFETDGLTPEQEKEYRTDLEISFHSPLTLLVESGHGKPPHVVTHDLIEAKKCDDDCNWYYHRLKGYEVIPPNVKLCGHMMRARLVLMRRHARRTAGTIAVQGTKRHDPDSLTLQHRMFSLLK